MMTPNESDVPSVSAVSEPAPTPVGTSAVLSGPIRPTTVVVSFWILIASAALRIFFAVLTVVGWNTLMRETLDQPLPAGTTLAQMHSEVQNYLIANIVLDVMFGLVYVLFAYMIRAGRNWARIAITLIVVVFGLFDILTGSDFYTLISVLIELVAVGLLYLRTAKEYFAAVKAANPRRSRR